MTSNSTNFLPFYQISTLFHEKSLSNTASYNQFPCIKAANSPLIRLNGVNFHELFTFFCITGVSSCELFLYAVKIHVLFGVFSRTRIGTKFFSPLFSTNFFLNCVKYDELLKIGVIIYEVIDLFFLMPPIFTNLF